MTDAQNNLVGQIDARLRDAYPDRPDLERGILVDEMVRRFNATFGTIALAEVEQMVRDREPNAAGQILVDAGNGTYHWVAANDIT